MKASLLDRLLPIGRGIVAIVSALATFYFVSFAASALLMRIGVPDAVRVIVSFVVALAAGVHVARFLIRRPSAEAGSARAPWMRVVLVSALVTGALGFLAGFIGPMILTPNANQGPMLGFMLGPAGFIGGGIGGAAWHFWAVSRRDGA